MLIKKATYKQVKVLQRKQVTPDVYGCDCCKTVIKDYPNEEQRLELTVFNNNDVDDTERLHFCSWDCVLKHIPKIKSNHFVSLPFIYYDSRGKRSFDQLVKLLKKLK